MLIEKLKKGLESKHLLKHDFYKLWTAGKLDSEILADYAKQYYKHVAVFPRYVSAIHSRCEDMDDRQVLLENLIEEERGAENHPKLWRDFASELGVSEEEINAVKSYKTTDFLVKKYFDLCEKSYAAGLGALYAYEYQTPAISNDKIRGLKEFYKMDSEKALKFFEVHEEADIWHSDEVAGLIKKLSPDQQVDAFDSASKAADALWTFLDGMMIAHDLPKC
jgi:pyrroloquinoline-quinone synthase